MWRSWFVIIKLILIYAINRGFIMVRNVSLRLIRYEAKLLYKWVLHMKSTVLMMSMFVL